MSDLQNRLFILDSFALAFRSFYAFIHNPLVNSKGEVTSVIFGYGNALLRLLQEESPSHIAVAKDLPSPTFRHEMYPQYKANRSEMPEEMQIQMPALDELLELLGCPVIGRKGYEADDVMASMTRKFKGQAEVLLVTRDKDMAQVVDDSTFLFSLEKAGMKNTVMDTEGVFGKYGVRPDQMGDYLALVGDSSDNIPGVARVGPKGAVRLLAEFGSLQGIYENLGKITKKAIKKNLETGRESAQVSRKLVTLVEDLNVDCSLNDMAVGKLDFDALDDFFERYELNSLRRRLSSIRKNLSVEATLEGAVTFAEENSWTCCLVNNKKDLNALAEELNACELLAFDTETSSLDPRQAKLVGICLATKSNSGWYLPLAHNEGQNLDAAEVRTLLQSWLSVEGHTVVMHNAKFDLAVLEKAGYDVECFVADTMIAASLLDTGDRRVGLDALVLRLLGHEMIPICDLIGKGKKQISFDRVPVETAAKYGAEDAIYTLRLWELFQKDLDERALRSMFETQEMPLVPVLVAMEKRGVQLDVFLLAELSGNLEVQSKKLEQDIYASADEEFNIASPKQLSVVLFDKLGLPHGKKTKTGYSTDVTVLEGLRSDYEIVDEILQFRELEKLRNTYVDALPKQLSSMTGRLHTSFNQVAAATGRLSSQDPNLQNIPIRSENGRKIRSAFTAPEGMLILSADYSQVELRMLAHLSKDENLLRAYREGLDIHTQTAEALFDTSDGVSAEMRRQAKIVNFGILYGMSAFRLARDLGISRFLAQEFIDEYFCTYPGVTTYIEETVARARRDGFVTTLSGRRRYFPDLDADNRNIQNAAERMAVNTPIQGSAADLIKLAMLNIHRKIETENLPCRMLLQVHDELVFEIPRRSEKELSAFVKKEMEEAMELDVPLEASVGTGKNWLEAH